MAAMKMVKHKMAVKEMVISKVVPTSDRQLHKPLTVAAELVKTLNIEKEILTPS